MARAILIAIVILSFLGAASEASQPRLPKKHSEEETGGTKKKARSAKHAKVDAKKSARVAKAKTRSAKISVKAEKSEAKSSKAAKAKLAKTKKAATEKAIASKRAAPHLRREPTARKTVAYGPAIPAELSDVMVRAQVEDFLNRYVNALNGADTTAVFGMYSPGVSFAMDGTVVQGQASTRKVAADILANPDHDKFTVTSTEVVPLGPSKAFAVVRYAVACSDQDLAPFHTTETFLLKRNDSKWEITHAHLSADAE